MHIIESDLLLQMAMQFQKKWSHLNSHNILVTVGTGSETQMVVLSAPPITQINTLQTRSVCMYWKVTPCSYGKNTWWDVIHYKLFVYTISCLVVHSPAPSEDRAAVQQNFLHRGVIRVSLWPHRGARRSFQLLTAHQSLLWLRQSWTCPLQRTLHVDPFLEWWRTGRNWLPGSVQLHRR